MNKTELAKCVADKLSVSVTESNNFINAIQDVLTYELQQNGYILLQGFGVFSPWEQTQRMGRNPKTGKPCIIASRISVKFKPGRRLLKALNTREENERMRFE